MDSLGIIIVLAVVALGYFFVTQSAGAQAMPNTSGTTYYSSDGSITGAPITDDSSSWPSSDPTWKMCCAIATAEGYNEGAGVIPYDYNNPGDITDEASQYGSGTNGITTFPSAETGWQALYDKLQNIVNGGSSAYPVSASWTDVGNTWSNGDANWAVNVCRNLGVDPSTTPAQYAQGA
jgi:hypothetical protein